MSQPTSEEERIKRFLAIASHDLQSPLRHIAMYAEILLEDLESSIDADQVKSLRTILDKAQAAQKLTKTLMSFAAGAPQIAVSDVELDPLVAEIWQELEQPNATSEVALEVGSLPKIRTDRSILRLILKNVIANALTHHGDGPVQVRVDADVAGSQCAIHVSDNGPAIDPATRDKIFDAFWAAPTEGITPGLGLGLAVVRDLATALGGDVHLDHSGEPGNRFTITLPGAR
ncbi:HAMP domain-containing histidine kinase [Rhizobium grahamii]|uniref:histidine kinase n=1 Tax=Rhizobium grahamii TaxID=1120045 RepID=A0A5Q0C0S1_9HYPH|nr:MULTISPECIES: HAMP domain-containing sensor histidine kinase [Rhizobium]QFY59043.1 HAMP domain-containing histidine kinase [Rhizobium grahamii]QRM48438.1 HAMP domain-containing histidine kinase [Rhizobium sp. BG6]